MPPQSGGIWVASQTVTKRLSRWCIHVLPDTVPRWSNFGCFDSVRQDEGAQTKLDSVNDQSYWIYYMKIYRLYTVSDYLKKTINNVWSSLHTYNLYGLAVEQWKKGMSTWIGMDLVPLSTLPTTPLLSFPDHKECHWLAFETDTFRRCGVKNSWRNCFPMVDNMMMTCLKIPWR